MAFSKPALARYLVVSLALSAALVVGLFVMGGVSLGKLRDAIVATDLGILLLIVLSTLIHLCLSAYKWQLVTCRLAPESAGRDGFVFHFFYTTLGALFGQVLPVQLSTVAARTVGLRLHHKIPQ